MTRRTFLRVLGSAAVAVTAAPYLPATSIDRTAYLSGPSASASVGAITLAMLEDTYNACVIGSELPQQMICSAAFARQLGIIYDVEIPD